MLSSTAHADLELRIVSRTPDAKGRFVYQVELTLDHAQESAPGGVYLDDLKPWDPAGVTTREQYGVALFEALLPQGALRNAWSQMAGQCPLRRVRLRIDPAFPHLHAIQWELLREPAQAAEEVALRVATPFSRYLAQDTQPGAPIVARPVRVLVAIANPTDLARFHLQPVDADAEYANLLNAAAGIVDEDGQPAIVFDRLPAPCTLEAIRERLKQGYHLLHFIGHGRFVPAGNGAPAENVLFLENPANSTTAFVSDVDLADMIANTLAGTASDDERLRLVFLESCQSASRDADDAFRGLAPRLVRSGVAAVVAMQDLVEVNTARPFAAVFYRQLLRHGLVDLACNEARAAVRTQKLRGAEVPVLFMRVRSGELLRVKGTVRADNQADFWDRLMERVDLDECVPFLGPRVNRGILPRPETVAMRLAEKNGYALKDSESLTRVAQFEALKDPKAFRAMYLSVLKRALLQASASLPLDRKTLASTTLSDLVGQIGWDTLRARIEETRIYDQLAALALPLYITSNADSFMAEALRNRKGIDPAQVRRIGPLWEKTTAGALEHSLHPAPSNDAPCVLHVNGFDGADDVAQLAHIALSEDDMLSAYVRLSRDQVQILPGNVVTQLSKSSWIFLGYNLDDWEFRVLLQGLLQPIAQSEPEKRLHVGVQFESAASAAGLNEAQVQKYLQDYLTRRFNITVYWGTPAQFVSQLYERSLAG
jgi:hypothetical protein